MPKSKTAQGVEGESTSGNYISEWLGHRIFPQVRLDTEFSSSAQFGRCPFLTQALRQPRQCIKNENSFGVCTVNSASNGSRQDWLVCPYRIISSDLVREAARYIFQVADARAMQPIPVTLLESDAELAKFKGQVAENGSGYCFFQDKLGGEISVVATQRSPEMSFDVTLVEVVPHEKGFRISRYGVLEIQTMDFHGSYKKAVANLRDALRLHRNDFPATLAANLEWASDRVEGPNIANVFKRTFYQSLLKFQLSGKGAAAGTVLALPQSVWDSWLPFLGAPELESSNGEFVIKVTEPVHEPAGPTNAVICVFDLDAAAPQSVSPVNITKFIRVTAEQLSHQAFKVVPGNILQSISDNDSILARIRMRMASRWPDLL